MSGADDLRTDIAKALMVHGWDATLKQIAEAMSFADPVRCLAILNLIGDVHEGRLRGVGDVVYLDPKKSLGFRDDDGVWHDWLDVVPVLVVRPRGEATLLANGPHTHDIHLRDKQRQEWAAKDRGEATDA